LPILLFEIHNIFGSKPQKYYLTFQIGILFIFFKKFNIFNVKIFLYAFLKIFLTKRKRLRHKNEVKKNKSKSND